MSEKPKITIKELKDIYDIEEEDTKKILKETQTSDPNSEFETYTEEYDKKEEEELLEDQNG